MPNKSIYIGVDHKNKATGRGRDSVRVHSSALYNHGLFIVDLAHMPASVCGTWPAFWFYGRNREWPDNGEINVLESKL